MSYVSVVAGYGTFPIRHKVPHKSDARLITRNPCPRPVPCVIPLTTASTTTPIAEDEARSNSQPLALLLVGNSEQY